MCDSVLCWQLLMAGARLILLDSQTLREELAPNSLLSYTSLLTNTQPLVVLQPY